MNFIKKNLPTASVLLAGICWGVISLFVHLFIGWGVPALTVACLRLTVSAVALLVFALIFKRNAFKVKLRHLPLLFSVGLFGLLGTMFAYQTAITMTSASVASILMYTSPIFIFIFSTVVFKERINLQKIIALSLAVVGCVFVSGILDGGIFTVEGILMGLLSGVTYALYSIIGVFALRHYDSLTVTLYGFMISGVLGLCFMDYSALGSAFVVSSSPIIVGLSILGVAVVCTIAPYTLYTWGLRRMEASRAGILACIEPIVATLVGVLCLSEGSTVLQIVGIVCVVGAIVLLQLSGYKKGDNNGANLAKHPKNIC